MSTKRPPIFTEEQLFGDESPLFKSMAVDRHVANYFTALAEAARAKDAELIQRFVDHHHKWHGRGCIEADMEWDAIIHDCHKAGFKPKKAMSTERPPLFDTSSLLPFGEKADIIRTYEAARDNDAKLIRMLVNDLRRLRIEFGNRTGQTTQIGIASLFAAEDQGFKPTAP